MVYKKCQIFKAALALARSLLRIAFVVVVLLLLLSAVVRKKAVNVSQVVKMVVRDCQNQS